MNRRLSTSVTWLGIQALALLAAAGVHARAGAVDWPQWRGPDRNGVTTETGWQATWPAAGPKVLWQQQVGTGYSSAAVRGNRVYTLGNKAKMDTVYCFDAETGNPLWAYAYPCSLPKGEADPNATPAADGDLVYTASYLGHIHALHAETGKVVWSVYAPGMNEMAAVPPRGRITVSASPLVDGKLLIVRLDVANVAFDKTAGQVVWVDRVASGDYASPVAFDMEKERWIAVFASKGPFVLNARTGEKLWSYPWAKSTNIPDPIVVEDKLFLAAGYGTGCGMFKPERAGPLILWLSEALSPQVSTPVIWKGAIYGVDGQVGKANSLVCLDAATGDEKWREHTLGLGTLIVADGKIVFLSEKGMLHVAEASPAGYKELARAQVMGGQCWTLPAFSGGRLYCRNHEGDLVCLDLRAK